MRAAATLRLCGGPSERALPQAPPGAAAFVAILEIGPVAKTRKARTQDAQGTHGKTHKSANGGPKAAVHQIMRGLARRPPQRIENSIRRF